MTALFILALEMSKSSPENGPGMRIARIIPITGVVLLAAFVALTVASRKHPAAPRGGTASAVEYRNEQYGFGMTFPSDWSGYSVIAFTWHGQTHDEQGETTGTYTGPEIILRHPQWTAGAPWQDIPVLVFTHDEWALVEQQKFGVSAAPTSPSKLGENAKFIFALPPRWIGFVDTLGQDEAGKVPETFRAF
ncbi:MAG: hypothetical protein ABSD29_22130 [Verrucomicrobiota bacterium]